LFGRDQEAAQAAMAREVDCMTQHTYIPEGVCSTGISFEIKDGALRNVQFTDSCSGNSQAISRLCEGMRIDDTIRLLKGIDCDDKGTSSTFSFPRFSPCRRQPGSLRLCGAIILQ